MDKEQTLQVISEIIAESTASMIKEAKQLLDTRDWNFDTFGDRNTFARVVMECIFDKEKAQYAAINNTKAYKQLKMDLSYELAFIHNS